jgi:oxygen-independent coproporphyrinogen-3 oxidase
VTAIPGLTEASLYVHVPFCSGGKCGYCDFYSLPVAPDDPRPERYVQTLLSEAGRLFETFRPGRVPTLYIGGGTPSVLGAGGINRLLSGILELVSCYSSLPEEITVEANPESAGEAFLDAIRGAGATRLSLGVQTFHGPSRRAVHRNGAESPSTLRRQLSLAAEYFPAAFSVDLISGLPFQTEKILLDDTAGVLFHKPAHVSFYALTREPGTPLDKAAGKDIALPGRDEADHLWLTGRAALEKAGYSQYEVSNFCQGGKESMHNIRYWRMRNWLALGPAASGTVINDETGKGTRYTVPCDIDAWLGAGGCTFSRMNGTGIAPEIEELDTPTLIKESILMGFRYIKGPDDDLFRKRFHKSIAECIPKTMGEWQGCLRKGKRGLTKEGLLLLDRFLLDAFGELDVFFELDDSIF